MSFPFQTMKKISMFLLLGIFPLLVYLILTVFGINLMESALIAIFFALILIVITHKITDSPFLRMFEGSTYGALTFDSRGKIDFFDVKLVNGTFKADYLGELISVPFNQGFFFRISQIFGKGKIEEKVVKTDAISKTGVPLKREDKEILTLTLEKDKYNTALFKTDFPILFYNRELKSFITKEWLHTHEKKDMLIAMGYEVNKQIKEYNKTASGITRMIVDLIGSKFKKQSWVIMLILIIVLGAAVWYMWPTLSETFGGTIDNATSAIGGANLPDKFG